MWTFALFCFGFLAVMLGMELFPPLHYIFSLFDLSGLAPLPKAAAMFLPYTFLFLVGYAIHGATKK